MLKNETISSDYKGVWIFTEIQDHERVLVGALELLTKGRELASKLGEKLFAVVFGLEVEQYLPTIEKYGPDYIIYSSSPSLKHYNGEIFPDMFTDLIKTYKPSIILFPCTEAGRDLAPRLAWRFKTGLTSHCSDLDIVDSKENGSKTLLMKRPAFSGNMVASILCPKTKPQLATVQQGVFQHLPLESPNKPELINYECKHDLSKLKVVNVEAPTRWNRTSIPLEKANVVLVGGRGLGSKLNFDKLFELADLLNAEVGVTRVPIFNEWCTDDRLIGQTGKTIKPELYLSFGVSGQIQHTCAILDSKRIISVNSDADANITEISDYVINEDVNVFLPKLIARIKKEKKIFKD